MKTVSCSLTATLFIAGLSWALAVFAWALGASVEWIFPLFMLGMLIGISEWILWQRLG